MRVSVVVCTHNRAEGVLATLAALRQQRYSDFEVVVVNGPSTDHTQDALRPLCTEIKLVENPLANLSVSRNLGIRASAGEIVAFIDDDALPEPSWLEQAIPAFDDDAVAGVGGIVLDHTGMNLQYRYSAATRFGEGEFSDRAPYDDLCVPGAALFPYLQGTNSLFRRSALAEIGLFDETFDFYLDETDVCCRLVDAGFVLRQLDAAPVHHKYLPSERRNERKVVTNWSSIVRNFVYFGYRHALLTSGETEILAHANAFARRVEDDARYHADMDVVPTGHVERAIADCGSAIASGIVLGRERQHLRLGPVALEHPGFVPFATTSASNPMRIVLVSSGYAPRLTGGISRFITDVAPKLAALGHEIRVFAKSSCAATVDLEDGVWVHRLTPASTPGVVPEASTHIDGFATAVVDELDRISKWWTPDVAYGSLWDVELLGIVRRRPEVAIVPMLATPVAEVAEHEGWIELSNAGHDVYGRLVVLEREVMARAAAVHGISMAIVATFERLYPGALADTVVHVAHIGRADDLIGPTVPVPEGDPMVLFVGRLEPRKGIDTFLDATERLLTAHEHVRIVIAGDAHRTGPDGTTYPDSWRRRGHPGSDRVSFVGAIDDDDLSALIDASTVVVMPSRYESFGLVVVEAMMHARVAVASDVGGIAEIIEHEYTGLLVPVGDADALAHAVGLVVSDPALADAMGRRGRNRFDDHLRVEHAADRLESILASVVAARIASPAEA
ncbi:MAG: glycosyltransferase [Ilumatobacteraceae bacterium]